MAYRPPQRPPRKRTKYVRPPHPIRDLPSWAVVGLAWLIARLPIRGIYQLGRGLGTVAHRVMRDRRHVTQTNIRLCFPELRESAQHELARAAFQQVAVGALEIMIPWLNPKRNLLQRTEISGRQYLNAAIAEGRGVILLGAHFSTLDVVSQALSSCGPIDVIYRYNKNPVWEWLQQTGRRRYFNGVIERNDARNIVRCLRQGRVIWYAADQDYGPRHSVFAPFFNVPAATIVATMRLARLTGSPVLLMRQYRDNQRHRWHIDFQPHLKDFPTGDDHADAAYLNRLLEAAIRKHPAQYLWLHKRFKTRPGGESSLYD